MVASEKMMQALYALQELLIQARFASYQAQSPAELTDLLDCAEYVTQLLASDEDETRKVRAAFEKVAASHGCRAIIESFDGARLN